MRPASWYKKASTLPNVSFGVADAGFTRPSEIRVTLKLAMAAARPLLCSPPPSRSAVGRRRPVG
jgi:hypothetical protein